MGTCVSTYTLTVLVAIASWSYWHTYVHRSPKDGAVKRSDCILVYGSTTKGDVVKRSDCILVYGSTTKGDVVKRSDCILVQCWGRYF